jgi:hypothetical protein
MQQPRILLPQEQEPICSLGKWLFVPDRRNPAGDVRIGHLSCNGERVTLQYCSGVLADFVRTIRQIEHAFLARCGTDPASAGG